jgi:hypothetical protein
MKIAFEGVGWGGAKEAMERRIWKAPSRGREL